jgi:hypothetical protein
MGKERVPRWQAVTRAGILLGLALLMAGFVVRDVRAREFVRADYLALGLWIAGAVLAVGGAVLNYRMFISLLSRRRTAEGVNFGLTVVLALALAGLLCFITSRKFARLDWTGKGTFTLHSKTRNILESLERDVTVTVLFAPSDDRLTNHALDSTMDLLEEFRSLTGRVTVQRVNWMQPGDQQRWEELRQQIGEDYVPDFSVVFTTEEFHEIVPLDKVVTFAMGRVQFTSEDAFAGALTKLTERRRATVYFLTGHGERPIEAEEPSPMPMRPQEAGRAAEAAYSLSRLARALRNDNYEVKTLNLAGEGAVPEDCDVLFVAGPRAPFSDEELKALRTYLDERDGRAVFMLDPVAVTGESSRLEALLARYDVVAHTDAVCTTNQPTVLGVMQSNQVPVLEDGLADHPITSDLKNYTVGLQYACPLTVEESAGPPGGPEGPGPTARKLLWSAITWGERDYRPDPRAVAQYEEGRDVSPPAVVAAVVAPQPPPQMGPVPPAMAEQMPGPKIVVIGSSLSFVNRVVQLEPANRYLVQNAVNWMAGKLHMLGIPPRTLEFNDVAVSEGQVAASRYIFIGGLPACFIVLGIAVWLLRRR